MYSTTMPTSPLLYALHIIHVLITLKDWHGGLQCDSPNYSRFLDDSVFTLIN